MGIKKAIDTLKAQIDAGKVDGFHAQANHKQALLSMAKANAILSVRRSLEYYDSGAASSDATILHIVGCALEYVHLEELYSI